VAYVDAGYFLDDYILEDTPVVRARGDDGGTLRRFWKKRADEWVEENLEKLQTARKPARVIRVVLESAESMETLPIPVAAIDQIRAAMDRPAPDYTMIAASLIAVLEQKKRAIRKRRDIEALLVLGW
jgi:hypothetical protein